MTHTPELHAAIARMITKHGEAFNEEVKDWGDTRGREMYAPKEHMETCSVQTMTGYTEEYDWKVYDTMSKDYHVGIRAFITCECGQVDNIAFIVPDAGLGTILGWLLDEEQP